MIAQNSYRRHIMLDNDFVRLAYNLHSSRGTFAIMLGSGVSVAAGIPSGYGIMSHLNEQICRLKEESPDLGELNYSEVIQKAAKKPSERRKIIASYIEPNQDEFAKGLKMPTKAHRAIANLVKNGYVKLIITTNFDRLMELALQELGIFPLVLSSESHFRGAPAIQHRECVIIKLHGDYQDDGILNTDDELRKYSRSKVKLLNYIFDHYGLIVCGWSATWDYALRTCFEQNKTRRYSQFFTAVGAPSPELAKLAHFKDGILLSIESADTFFSNLDLSLKQLEKANTNSPISKEIAIAKAKILVCDKNQKIELHDFLIKMRDLALSNISKKYLGNSQENGIEERIKKYESALDTLIPIVFILASWSNELLTDRIIELIESFLALGNTENQSGDSLFISLRQYPAMLLFFSAGLGALSNKNYDLLTRLLTHKFKLKSEYKRFFDVLIPKVVIRTDCQYRFKLLTKISFVYPLNFYLCHFFKETLSKYLMNQDFELIFDRFETLLCVAHLNHFKKTESLNNILPLPGRYLIWDQNPILTNLLDDLKDDPTFHPYGNKIIDSFSINLSEAIYHLLSYAQRTHHVSSYA